MNHEYLFLSEDEKLFQSMVLDFAREAVAPFVRDWEEHQGIPLDLIQKLFEQGFMSIEVPEPYGGSGSTFFNCILAIEALAKFDPAVSVFVDVHNTLFLDPLCRYGSEDLKKNILPLACSHRVGCYALTEPGSGSDAFALQTRAQKTADGYLITGQKVFITNAGDADFFLVFANLNLDLGYKGITCFLLEKGQEGLSLGKKEDKLGIRASTTCEVLLKDCFVPFERLVGQEGEGYKIAIETLNGGRIGIAAQMVGLAQGAFDLAQSYANERKQFGKLIRQFQGVQFDFAKQATQIQTARLLLYQAAQARDAQKPILQIAAMAKYWAGIVAEQVSSWAIEVLGGYGYTKDFLAEKFFRDSKIGSIYEGTTNMQLGTIAKTLWEEV